MRPSFDERGGVTAVRVQEDKLTYPVLLPFFSEVRRRVEGGTRRLGPASSSPSPPRETWSTSVSP
jgi:hypothetical protein